MKYSATAGIITVLSIRNTKRETLRSAVNRGMAYVCALILAYICFRVLGYSLPAFAVYLFLFAFLCMTAGWQEAITTDSVLVTHFMNESSMNLQMLANETALFLIGAGMGILMNLHLHSREADFTKLADGVDTQIKGILRQMSLWLPRQVRKENEDGCFRMLEETIRQAKICAVSNYNNDIFRKNTYQLDYIRMREKQAVVLKGICQNIRRIEYLPQQAMKVASLLGDVEQAYHRDNTVEALLIQLHGLFAEMKQEKLPENREEFEARAILFYILMQIEELLLIKRRFIADRETAGGEQISGRK